MERGTGGKAKQASDLKKQLWYMQVVMTTEHVECWIKIEELAVMECSCNSTRHAKRLESDAVLAAMEQVHRSLLGPEATTKRARARLVRAQTGEDTSVLQCAARSRG